MDPVTHFEIPYDDEEKAKEFYEKVFSWKMQSMPEMNYTIVYTTETNENNMASSTNKINGGMFKKSEPNQTPVIVIDVQNIEETLEKIKQSGGEIITPTQEIGDMGLYAKFKDNQGNILGVWQTIKKEIQ